MKAIISFGLALVGAAAVAGEVRTFGPGTHYLTETAVFTAADSGSVWKAEPGAKPAISGARKVSGWRKAGNGLFVADVPWVTDRQRGFRQLVVDGSLRPRARHPNAGHFTSLDMERPEGVTWHQWEYNYEKPRFHIKPGEVDPAWNLACGEVVFYHIWVDSHCPTASLTVDRGTNWLNLATAVRRNPCNSLWRLENLKEIADEPGEWALDFEAKKLYYRPCPGEDLTKAEVLAPDVQTLVRIDGARDVRFEGLTFADARFELAKGDRNDTQASYSVAAAVELTNAVNCVFEDCTFTRLGGYALDFQAGTRDCRVTKCSLMQLGAGGVRLNATGGRQTAFTAIDQVARYQMPDPRVLVVGNEISDCEIADFGREFPSAVGVLCMSAEGTKITHNAIHDGYYTGVSVGWTWGYTPSLARDNEVDYNHIYNIGKGLLSDMGGIYTLGVSPGTKLRHNLIHDIDARYYGGWGIYPDEGSSGILIEDNIVYNTKFSAYHLHFGRDNTVRNNILAGGQREQLTRSRREPHTSFAFYNNIVWWTEGPLHTGDWNDAEEYDFTYFPGRSRKLKKTTLCDYNVYYNPGKKIADVKFGTAKTGAWADWQKAGQDRHSVYADPLFKDVAAHDYTLLPDSPALKLGFRPIDVTTIGPRRKLDDAARHASSMMNPNGISGRIGEKGGVKVAFIGNSITLHESLPSIGWTNSFGMAASAAERDYVHLMTRGIELSTGRPAEVIVRNLADFERNFERYDVANGLKDVVAFEPDYLVVALGENVANLPTAERQAAYREAFLRLMKLFLAGKSRPATVVRGVFWANPSKDAAMASVAGELGVPFVPTADLGADRAMTAYGLFKHGGVQAHPGDRGMAAIADRLLKALVDTKGK